MDLVDKIKLLSENRQLTALIIAIIDAQETKRVTLTKEQAERVHPDGHRLKSHTDHEGNVTLWLETPH